MIFNSLPFLVFIFAFVPVYYLLKGKARIVFCLLASYFFYGWWDYRFLALILFSTLFDFTVSRFLEKMTDTNKRKILLTASIITNLGILAFFKYFNFFIDSGVEMLHMFGFQNERMVLQIILPVGISFYTFQAMSYTIDVYKRKVEAEKDFFTFATFIVFFPQLMAGPIVRAVDFLPQIKKEKNFNWGNMELGLAQVLVGFVKKIVIADSLAVFADTAFAQPGSYSSLYLILGIVFYSFQIYCDFSGYSDIAIGLAKMLGFEFPMNFNMPYFSQSFSEFWQRWHITLSSWLRDYLYISLGGNRGGNFKTYRNLMLTMLLGGLWHGASWTFVFWGFLHGLYLILQRMLDVVSKFIRMPLPSFIKIAINVSVVYILTCFAWVFFRSPDFVTAMTFLKGIFAFSDMSFSHLPNQFIIVKNIGLIALLVSVELISTHINLKDLTIKYPVFRLASYAVMLWFISLFGSFTDSQFIYFQF